MVFKTKPSSSGLVLTYEIEHCDLLVLKPWTFLTKARELFSKQWLANPNTLFRAPPSYKL